MKGITSKVDSKPLNLLGDYLFYFYLYSYGKWYNNY